MILMTLEDGTSVELDHVMGEPMVIARGMDGEPHLLSHADTAAILGI